MYIDIIQIHIQIQLYESINPTPDYTNLTSSIRLQPDDYRIKTITNHNQYHIHTHIHIQLHLHNHIFTMNLYDFMTLLQPNFGINQSTKKRHSSNDDRIYKT